MKVLCKKLLVFILTLALISGHMVTASAADQMLISVGESGTTYSLEKGDILYIPVKISGNTGIGTVTCEIDYDKKNLVLEGPSDEDLDTGNYDGLINGVLYEGSFSGASARTITRNGNLFWLKFRTTENVKNGIYPVSIKSGYTVTDGDNAEIQNLTLGSTSIVVTGGSEVTPEKEMTVSVGEETEYSLKAGEYVFIPITVTDNTGVGTFTCEFEYDKKALVLEDLSDEDLDTGNYDSLMDGVLYDSAFSGASARTITRNGTLFWIKVKTTDSAEAGTYPIRIKSGYTVTDGDNKAIPNITLESTNVVVTKEEPKVLTDTNTTVTLDPESYVYTGKAITPEPTVVYEGNPLTKDTDYTLSYEKNVDAGTATVTVTGAGEYSGAVNKTFEIAKAAAGITVNPTAYTKTFGNEPFDLGATVTSGATLRYSSDQPGVVTVDENGKVTVVGAGAATITIRAPETANYTAPESKVVTVTVSKADQTITGKDTYEKIYGDAPFQLDTALTGETGNLSYLSGDPAVASVDGNGLVTLKKEGRATITVTAAENQNYSEAKKEIEILVEPAELTVSGSRSMTLYVNGDEATITEDILKAETVDGTDAAIEYSVKSGDDVIALHGTQVQPLKAGNAVIDATVRAANHRETTTEINITVQEKSNIDIDFDGKTAEPKTYDGTAVPLGDQFRAAVAGDIPVKYEYEGQTYDSLNALSEAVTVSDAGTYTVKAIAESNESVGQKEANFVIAKAETEIAVEPVSHSKVVGDEPFSLGATVTSDATLRYSSDNTDVASVDENGKVTVNGAGNATITISAPETANYTAPESKVVTVTVSKADQAPLTVASATTVYGQDLTLTADGGSGDGAVTFAILKSETDTGEATIRGDVLTPVRAGTVTVQATKAGDQNRNDVISEPATITIEKATPELKAEPIEYSYDGQAVPVDAIRGTATTAGADVAGSWSFTDSEKEYKEVDDSGEVSVTFTPEDAVNYNGGTTTLMLTIVKADVDHRDLCPTMHFTDINHDPTFWTHEPIDYVYEHAIMQGTSTTTFEPDTFLNRAMIAQTLYNMEGRPEASASDVFTDVKAESWYSSAVNWAAENGLVKGFGDGTFGPLKNLTREQSAAILQRYAEYKGYDVSETGDLSQFKDQNKISSWAEANVSWAVGVGLLRGMGDGSVQPQGTTTRAQIATLMMRFDKMEFKKAKYRIVKADLSWEEAKKAAEEQGGQLVSINDDTEFAEIEAMLSKSDLQLCWVGACIGDDEHWDQAKWLDGTSLQTDKWFPGEPSHSNYGGFDERYLELWNPEGTGWGYNDAVNVLFDMYKGKAGYIIEFSV